MFSGEDDLFNDIFQQKSTLEEILHAAQLQFSPEEFQKFKIYRERRLDSIPLEKPRLKPTREPTPSVSLSGSSSTNRSKSKSEKEMFEHSKRSGNEQDKREGSVKDTAQSMELLHQEVIASPQRDPPPLVIQALPVITKLDREWETFNDLINLEGKTIKTPVSNAQVLK